MGMKKLLFTVIGSAICLLVSCHQISGVNSGTPSNAVSQMTVVPGVDHQISGAREIMRAKFDDKDVVAVLSWRPYDIGTDTSVSRWYGDMGTPPPKLVVDSLIISVDGRGAVVPRAMFGYLCSQRNSISKSMGLVTHGENICVYIDLGDGAEGWTASYVIDPSTGILISHHVQDGPKFHNKIKG